MLLALLLAAVAAGAQAPEPRSPAHRAPYESLAGQPQAAGDERQRLLGELVQRGIAPPDARNWSPEDLVVLQRVRSAEAAGAVDLLRAKGQSLSGLAVAHKAAGENLPRMRLTRAGWEKYRLLRTQDALSYFEEKGIDTKWAFRIRDLDGRPLFDPDGRLNETGDGVYARARANLPVYWQDGSGRVYGTRAPKAAAPKAPSPAKRER